MGGTSRSVEGGRNEGIGGEIPYIENKPPTVSTAPLYSSPLSLQLLDRLNSQGTSERWVFIPSCAGQFFKLPADALARLSTEDHKIEVVLDQANFPHIRLPSTHPATDQGQVDLIPLIKAEQAESMVQVQKNTPASAFTEWDFLKFDQVADNYRWSRGLGDKQIDALIAFMNIARISDMADVPDALRRSVSAGGQDVVKAASAVYQSGIGNINKPDKEGKTCLHDIISFHAQSVPKSSAKLGDASAGDAPLPLAEQFERALMLGADPLVADKGGRSAFELAAEAGCLEPLANAMVKASPLDEINKVLWWKNGKGRNILSLAVASGEEAIRAVRKLAARTVCGYFPPRHSFSTKDASLREKVKADWNGELNDMQITALARFMEVAKLTHAPRQVVIDALHPDLAVGYRPNFEAARAVYASGVGNINKWNANDRTCLHELPNLQIPQHNWTDNETEKVEFDERLAVMLELGADPFSTGSDGKLESALQFAQSQLCGKMVNPLSLIKKTLFRMTDEKDNESKRPINHAASAEAVNFLCDLGVVPNDYDQQGVTVPAALAAWLKRNPSELDRQGFSLDTLVHPFLGMPAELIAAYVGAIRARELSKNDSKEDAAKAVRNALEWSSTVQRRDAHLITLFNCLAAESAEVVLKSRIEARLGEEPSEWQNWCDREWNALLNNPNDGHRQQSVASNALADILLQHNAVPSDAIKSHPEWSRFATKVTEYDAAT